MPPASPENYTDPINEKPQNNEVNEDFLEIEKGDVDQTQSNSSNSNNIQQDTAQPVPQNAAVQPDPVKLVQDMISAGFAPTRAQISSAKSNLTGPNDSSNTWFAIFLQKLLRQKKIDNTKKR